MADLPPPGTQTLTRTSVDMSGMGGSYEWCCQRMLEKGLAWIDDRVLDDESKKELEDIITIKGCTGAQHGAVMQHLRYIDEHGYDPWLEDVAAADEAMVRIIEFDGTLACCPPLNEHSANFMKETYGVDWEDSIPADV